MYFTDEAVNSCAHISFYLEHRLKEWEIHQLMRSLKVFAVIPFNNRVLKFTNSICITEYLENSILYSSWLTIIWICQNIILSRLSYHRRKPLYRININHSLHIEKIYCYFYCVSLAYLINWLNIGPIY
jgi:hypothetical protein